MKITAIDIKNYRLPLEPPFKAAWDPSPRRTFTATIVRVHTDEGITGIGSGDAMLGLAEHADLFIGHDPFNIERHWQVLDNLDFHYGRCWPLDVAIWDILGKTKGESIAKLLGAPTLKILAYASTGEMLAPEERTARVQKLLDQGFKALKIRFHHADPRDDIKVVEAVRKAVGDHLTIMVDANQGWNMPWDTSTPWDFERACQVAKALEDLDVYWLEEPLPHYDFRGLARLRRETKIRIAGGEMNRRWHDFREMRHPRLPGCVSTRCRPDRRHHGRQTNCRLGPGKRCLVQPAYLEQRHRVDGQSPSGLCGQQMPLFRISIRPAGMDHRKTGLHTATGGSPDDR